MWVVVHAKEYKSKIGERERQSQRHRNPNQRRPHNEDQSELQPLYIHHLAQTDTCSGGARGLYLTNSCRIAAVTWA